MFVDWNGHKSRASRRECYPQRWVARIFDGNHDIFTPDKRASEKVECLLRTGRDNHILWPAD
jgi:hypothetical protein